MSLISLKLKNFRNHKDFYFTFPLTTVVIGKNTVGKTSILEAIQFLSHGKSFKAEFDADAISEGHDFANIEAKVTDPEGTTNLKIILAKLDNRVSKKFLVNNVARRSVDFTSRFLSVLFTPEDLEIIIGSPSLRREYINSILSQTDKKYRVCLSIYEKALRHRNRMLYLLREGKKMYSEADFEYWDNILIDNGSVITSLRESFVEYVNSHQKDIFPFDLFYDKSTISRERLDKYHYEERAAAKTLVGPNRDDFFFRFSKTKKPISEFGSRGEQRLTVFQLKIIEMYYIKAKTGQTPTLLLDDIFSELDDANIQKVLTLLPDQQAVLTTTHKEFVPKKVLSKGNLEIIEL